MQTHDALVSCMSEHISLRFDWDKVERRTISDVLGLDADILSNGAARLEAVAICLDDAAVVVMVEPDTDQVIVTCEPPPVGDGWARILTFDSAISKPLGWSWVGRNSQGYKDSFTIAFGDDILDALQPRCTFLAEASSLICFDLVPRRAR